jgi:hypothetical protein
MKKLLFLLTLGLTGCPHNAATYSIQWTWQSGNPNLPICAGDGCATTYTLVQDGVVVATVPASQTSYLEPVTSGTHLYTLTANGIDNNGKVVSSTPAKATMMIP